MRASRRSRLHFAVRDIRSSQTISAWSAWMRRAFRWYGRTADAWSCRPNRLRSSNLRIAAENVREQFEKYYFEPFDTADGTPRLSAVYVLRDAQPVSAESFELLTLPDVMRLLEFQACRPILRHGMGNKADMLTHAARVLGHTKFSLQPQAEL